MTAGYSCCAFFLRGCRLVSSDVSSVSVISDAELGVLNHKRCNDHKSEEDKDGQKSQDTIPVREFKSLIYKEVFCKRISVHGFFSELGSSDAVESITDRGDPLDPTKQCLWKTVNSVQVNHPSSQQVHRLVENRGEGYSGGGVVEDRGKEVTNSG